MPDQRPTAPHAKAVERALAILECLDGSRRGLNISEIARKLRAPKSSVHVIMLTLERLGYLRKEPGTRNYVLSLKAYALGQKMTRRLSLAAAALPHMRLLVEKLRLTAHLAVLDRDQGVFVQKVEAPGLIRFDTYVGRRMDLHCTAAGKVILAFESADAVQPFLSKQVYVRYTEHTITSSKGLRRELNRIRKKGHAIDDEEEELGVRCVAVPVFDRDGRFLAALSVTGTVGQIPLDRIESIAGTMQEAAAGVFSAGEPEPAAAH